MMRNLLLFVIAAVMIIGIQNAYSTHISQPILTIDENFVYSVGDNLSITGWVEYDDAATSDVLLSVKISNPNGIVVSDFFLTSDSDGKFEFPFQLTENDASGDYLVNIMSMCREIHRDICTHKTAETTISVIGEQSKIPDWVRNVFVWYAEDSISEKELLQALQFLIKEKIIQVDYISNT
tara:strand:+ start:75 stop:614 length:540 start_codon:yes stop_codon:yes gene_type:complete